MSLVTQLPQSKSKPPQSPERATGSRQVSAQSKRTAPPAKKRPPAAGKKPAPAKQAGDAGAAGTEKSQTLGPERDPRFKRVANQLKKGAAGLKKHPPASKKASEAQAAAQPPANEKLAGAKANQVDAMKEAKAEKPQPNAFLALLRAEIKKVMPANLDEADSFMEGSDKAELESAVTGKVNEQKDEATGEIKSASTQAPDRSSVEGKEVMPMPADPAAPAPVVRGNEAMPAPKPDKEISQQQKKIDAQKMMDDAEITEPQMKKANDPRFSAVLSAKSNVQKTADASPGKYRAGEKGMLGRAMAQAQTLSKQGVAMLLGVKTKSGAAVKSRQEAAKEKDEKRRKEVADTIEGIYNKTKEEVDLKLSTLESEVLSTFQAGIERNLTALKEDTRKEVEDYKDERYSGIRGKARWIRDQFRPLVPGVKEIIQRNLTVFTDAMDALVVRIADLVESKLNDAKKEIDKGQASIKSYVESLPKDLQAVGKAAEKEMSSRFDDMRKGVDDRQNDLAQKLAAKYKEAQDQATAIAKKIEDENKGAVYKLAEAIGEVIKMLAEFKDKLMAALRKGWAVIKQIINDPIGFLSNLLAAIKQGFNQFRERFLVHLERGFIKWLFGAMAGSGVELPKDLSLPSILKMVMQVLGLTYERMRAKAVKLIGERNVAILEKVFEYVKALITEGPAALWEKIKADLSNLKDMVIGAIQRWILTQIIKSAVTKLVTMFNPVGAIIQALITIYNTVMFVIENASRLLEFVEAVVNSVSEIASGAISKAANWIETALGNLIPIVIGFLARLIGLGGIAGAVKDIIKKVQGAVDRAIDKLIERVIGTVKKLFGKDKPTGKKAEEKREEEGDVPSSIIEPSPGKLTEGSLTLVKQIAKAASGTVIYQGGGGNAKEATKKILREHKNAKFNKDNKQLTLPPVEGTSFSSAGTLEALGAAVAKKIGVSKVRLKKSERRTTPGELPVRIVRGGDRSKPVVPDNREFKFELEGEINPIANVLRGSLSATGQLIDAEYIPTNVTKESPGGSGITLKITPAAWNGHILPRHVLSTLDRTDTSERTVFLRSPAEYAARMEEIVNNQAVRNVVKPGVKGMKDIEVARGGRTYKLKVNLTTGEIESFHATGGDDHEFARLPWQDSTRALQWTPRPRKLPGRR